LLVSERFFLQDTLFTELNKEFDDFSADVGNLFLDGDFKWVMHYQGHLAKFNILRPLMSKRAAEVAYQFTDIFLLLGAPHILQSDNGREFTAS
jgi:hypothetical protein